MPAASPAVLLVTEGTQEVGGERAGYYDLTDLRLLVASSLLLGGARADEGIRILLHSSFYGEKKFNRREFCASPGSRATQVKRRPHRAASCF